MSTGFSLNMEMSRLTWDGTAEPVLRAQTLMRELRQAKFVFPVQLTMSTIGNLTRLILTLAICDDHRLIIVDWNETLGKFWGKALRP